MGSAGAEEKKKKNTSANKLELTSKHYLLRLGTGHFAGLALPITRMGIALSHNMANAVIFIKRHASCVV